MSFSKVREFGLAILSLCKMKRYDSRRYMVL